MKRCIHCGERLEDDAAYCPECGAKQPVEGAEIGLGASNDGEADLNEIKEMAQILAARKEAERQRKEEEKRRRAQYSVMPSAQDFDINICQEAAQGGWAPAQRNLGMCYLTGRAVNTDVEEVIAGLTKDVRYDAHSNQFMVNIGGNTTYYLHSLFSDENNNLPGKAIIEKDVEKGAMWLRMAAESGDKDAQFWLGECYGSSGYGVKSDGDKGDEWRTKGAENGGAYTQIYMGIRYNGLEDKALMWFNKAAAQGNDAARNALLQKIHKDNQRTLVATVVDRYIDRIVNGSSKTYNSSACSKSDYAPFLTNNRVMSNVMEKIVRNNEDGKDIVGVVDTSLTGNGKAGLVFTASTLYDRIFSSFAIPYSRIPLDLSVTYNKKGKEKKLVFAGCEDCGLGSYKGITQYIDTAYFHLAVLRDCLLQIKSALCLLDSGYPVDSCLVSIR